jgi:hypothetical protein
VLLSGALTLPRFNATVTTASRTIAGQPIDRADARVRTIGGTIAIDRLHLESGEAGLTPAARSISHGKPYVAHATA